MITSKEALSRAVERHGDTYKYPNWNYKGMAYPIKIECKIHGEFEQLALNHIHHGKGCLKCSGRYKKTFEEHVEDCKIKHNNLYTYPPNQVIQNNKSKIAITCNIHGNFYQTLTKHKTGSKCPKCVGGVSIDGDIFKEKCKVKDLSNVLYDKVYYINSQTPVTLTCIKHGDFKQRPNDHLQGKGCPKCVHKISKPEIELHEFIESLGLEIITNSRNIIGPKELDIYIPSLNKAIEFNGMYYHYGNSLKPGRHALKSNMCREKGIVLLHVREDLWKNKPHKMKKIIEKFLNN